MDPPPLTGSDPLAKAQEAIYARADARCDTWAEMLAYAGQGNDLTYSAVTSFDKLLTGYVSKKDVGGYRRSRISGEQAAW